MLHGALFDRDQAAGLGDNDKKKFSLADFWNRALFIQLDKLGPK